MTATLQNQATRIYWWDGADENVVSGGKPELTESGGKRLLADRFDLQEIARAAVTAYQAAMPPPVSPELIAKLNALASYLTEEGEYEAVDLIDTVVARVIDAAPPAAQDTRP
jgi:hypothetical protein